MSSYLLYYHEDRTHLGLAKGHASRSAYSQFALSVKKQDFNPFRGLGRATPIVMRWQRRFKSHFPDDQNAFVCNPAEGRFMFFLRASFRRSTNQPANPKTEERAPKQEDILL